MSRTVYAPPASGAAGASATLPQLEAVPFTVYGHSMPAGVTETTDSRWPNRLASRLRTAAPTNQAVSAYTMAQTAQKILTTWTPNTRGLVAIQAILNDVQAYTSDTNGPKTTREGLRAALAFLTAGAVYGSAASCLAYGGTWVAGPTSNVYGGATKRTTTAGSYVDVAFNGDKVHLLTQFTAGTGQGTVSAYASTTGASLGSWDLGGMATALAGSTPAVLSLTGQGAGPHTVRFTFTGGAGFTVNAVLVPNPNPPTILLVKEGPVQAYFAGYTANAAAGNTALTTQYEPAVDVLATTFPTLIMTPTGGPAGWTVSLHGGQDQLHPNQRGSSAYADAAITALSSVAWREGQNWIQLAFSDTPPTPSYVAPADVTAPTAPTGLTVGTTTTTMVPLSWSAATDNVAVTGYKVRRDGTVIATPTTTSYIDSGRTASTTYAYTVSATDAAGNESAQSTSVNGTTTATSSPPFTDTFDGPSIDTTKWVNNNGAPSIVSGRLRIVPTTAYPQVASADIFDLTSYPVFVQIPTATNAGNATVQTIFSLNNSNYSSSVFFNINNNPRTVWMHGAGPAPTAVSGAATVTYDPLVHVWFRFRISGANLLYESSADGTTWTVQRTVVTPAWLTTAPRRALLQAVYTGTEPTPGYAEFDNFCVTV